MSKERQPLGPSAREKLENRLSRRQLIRWTVYSAVGAGIFFMGAFGIDDAGSILPQSETSSGKPQTSTTSSSIGRVAYADHSPFRVKTVYALMAQNGGANDEYFVLESPAFLGDLIKDVLERHAPLSKMMPSMQILIDGLPAKPSTPGSRMETKWISYPSWQEDSR